MSIVVEHICMVCYTPSWTHEDTRCWPPRCCHGCGCGEELPESPEDDQ